MPFLCKSHIRGEIVEQLILLETFEEAVIWANRYARIERGEVYQVEIYEVPFGLLFSDAYSPSNPIRIIKPCN